MNIDATFTKNQIAKLKRRCSKNGIEIRVDGQRLSVDGYGGPPLRDHDGCDPDLRKLVNKELHKRGIKLGEASVDDNVEAALCVIKNYKQLADVASMFRQAREDDSSAPVITVGELQSAGGSNDVPTPEEDEATMQQLRDATRAELARRGITQSPSKTEEVEAAATVLLNTGSENMVTDAANRLADRITRAYSVAERSEMPKELVSVVARLPKGCNIIAFVEGLLEACAVPGCGGAFHAAWMPPVQGLIKQEGLLATSAPDLLSQFVSASVTAVGCMERAQTTAEMERIAADATRRAVKLEREHSKLAESAALWTRLEKEVGVRGIPSDNQAGCVLAGALVRWGTASAHHVGNTEGLGWPWACPAASLPVYALVGAFLDEWNRAAIIAKHDCGRYNDAHTRYAVATADLTCALAALARSAQREHDIHVCDGREPATGAKWEEHLKERTQCQKFGAWVHMVWKEAAGCMKEEQAKCWERVRYFYNFRIKRGIEARPTDDQLIDMQAYTCEHPYMLGLTQRSTQHGIGPLMPGESTHKSVQATPDLAFDVDHTFLLRSNYDGVQMASLAKRAFSDEATEEGRKKEKDGGFENQWRICVARDEYDRSTLSPYPMDDPTMEQVSRLHGRFPRAQGWAPVETKDYQMIGMGLYTRYICSNCAKWAPRAPVCPGCRSARFCSDKCRDEAMAEPSKIRVTTDSPATYSNTISHGSYCNGKTITTLPIPEAGTPTRFCFPTGVNICEMHVHDAIRVLAEHGMTNLNVLIHCTRRIDVGRHRIGPKGARLLLTVCDNAVVAMHNRENIAYVHILHWLPLFWTLFAPSTERPCTPVVKEMIETPRRFATHFFELIVSWAPMMIKVVEPKKATTVSSDGTSAHVCNPTHNIPIYLLTTLRGILRATHADKDSIYQAFWDGMGRGLMNALFIILFALERSECRLEHNMRSLPDVVLHILLHLCDTVHILPTHREAERCLTAIGACGWSRVRSRLASAWIRSVRHALSDRPTGVSQSEWKRLEERAEKPDGNYYKNFRVPQRHTLNRGWGASLTYGHKNPNNFIALTGDPPDTLAASCDKDHCDNQSELSSVSSLGDPLSDVSEVEPSSDEEDEGSTSWCPKYRAARTIQRHWFCSPAAVAAAQTRATKDKTTKAEGVASSRPRPAPMLAGHAKAPYRPNDWVDIVTPYDDLLLSKSFASFKSSHFGCKLNAMLATRPRQRPFYND